ncbi:MAG: LAGLIDADG family homing endonuclease [Candidatus Hadarchaeum sp.]|uniref:LAGLIDADG family homing endonuclease n=1 Tax=Candidatus Hadarchaeum sp. TaxID=2883567 RepID=UPI00317D1EDA
MKRLNATQISEVIKGAQTGASLSQLSTKFGLRKTTIYYHVRGYCRKMGKFDGSRLSEWEKGYLVGVFVGDGCFNFRQKYYSYMTKLTLNAKSEQPIVDLLITILRKANTKPWITINENRFEVRVSSKGFCSFLKGYAGYGSEKGKLRKRLFLREGHAENFLFGVLAGLIDSDGCVAFDRKKYLRAMISTKSKVLATTMLQLVNILEIHATVHRSSGFTVRISAPFLKTNAQNIRSLKLKQKFNWGSHQVGMVGP